MEYAPDFTEKLKAEKKARYVGKEEKGEGREGEKGREGERGRGRGRGRGR